MKYYRVHRLIVSGLAASVVSAAATYADDLPIADMDVATAETNTVSRQPASTDEPIRVTKESLQFMTVDELRHLYYRLSDPADRRTVWEEIDKRKDESQETAFVPQEEANRFGAVNHSDSESMPELEEVQIIRGQIASASEDDENARQATTRESDPRKNRRNQRRTGNIGTAYSQ